MVLGYVCIFVLRCKLHLANELLQVGQTHLSISAHQSTEHPPDETRALRLLGYKYCLMTDWEVS